jgi:hypothetical protein
MTTMVTRGAAGRHRDIAVEFFRGGGELPCLHPAQDGNPSGWTWDVELLQQTIAPCLAARGQQASLGYQLFQVISRGLRCSETKHVLHVTHRWRVTGEEAFADKEEDSLTGRAERGRAHPQTI